MKANKTSSIEQHPYVKHTAYCNFILLKKNKKKLVFKLFISQCQRCKNDSLLQYLHIEKNGEGYGDGHR